MAPPKAHSPCTQFFSSTINHHKCSLFIGHDDGSVSLINFESVEGSLIHSSHFIEKINSETVLGFVECDANELGELAFVCWSRNELKIIDTRLKIIADLTSRVKDCGKSIRGVIFEKKSLLVIMERGNAIRLFLGPEYSVLKRKGFNLFRKRNQYGLVKLVRNSVDSRLSDPFYVVTWTDSYFSKHANIRGVESKQVDVKMFSISEDGSLMISLIDNHTEEEKSSIAFLDLNTDGLPIVKTCPIPKDGKDQQALYVGFSNMRYQAFILTENRIITSIIGPEELSHEITSQDVEERFPTLTNVKFKFLTSTQHVQFVLLEEAGKVIVFNTSPEDMDEVISVGKALVLDLPVHKKFTTQQSKLFNMATERKLTNVEFRFD